MPSVDAADLTVVAPSPSDGSAARALSALLGRGRTGSVTRARPRLLFSLFGCEPGPDEEEPAGAVSYLGDAGLRPEGYWLRADPVHLRATLRDVFLEPPRSLGLAQEEAEQLTGDINRHFADRGWRLAAPKPERWYLQTPPMHLRTHPTPDVAGRNINAFLPSGADARTWGSIGNELQMLLHGHPVNDQREKQGRLTVNGLWFWGGGTLPKRAVASWRHVWSDDPLVKGLASLSRSPVSALPADPQGIGKEIPGGGKFLVVLDADEDMPEESHPLMPWLPFLRSGFPGRVTLLTPGEPALSFSRSAARLGWRQFVDRLPGLRRK